MADSILPKPAEKAALLIEKRQEKIDNLGNRYTTDTLFGLNDADTPITSTHGAIREQDPYGRRYDAVELQHGNSPYDIQGAPLDEREAYQKSEYAMLKQREQVARLLNKPVESLTEQDMIDVGNMQQIQKLADLAMQPGDTRWEAPLIQGVEQTNLTGHYTDEFGNPVDIPLDIPVGVNISGQVSGGANSTMRTTGSLVNPAGENVTALSAGDVNQNAFAADDKASTILGKSVSYDYEKAIDPKIGYYSPDFIKHMAKTNTKDFRGAEEKLVDVAKSIPAGVLEASAMVAEGPENLYQALGGDYLEKNSSFAKEHPGYANAVNSIKGTMADAAAYIRDAKTDLLGYDDASQQKIMADIGKSFDQGNYFKGIIGAVWDNPLGAVELGANMWAISRAMAAKGITGLPAIAGSFADNANEAQKIYAETYGRPATGTELSALLGAAAIGTAMDTAAAKWIFKKGSGEAAANQLGRAYGALVNKVPGPMLQAALGGAGKLSAFMGIEAFQEGFTEAAIVAGGTQDFNEFLDEKHQKRIYEAAAAGAIAGPGMKVTDVATAVGAAITPGQGAVEKIRTELDRRKATKSEETPTADAEVTVDTTKPFDVTTMGMSKVMSDTDIIANSKQAETAEGKARISEAVSAIVNDGDVEEQTFGSSEKALEAIEFVLDNSVQVKDGKTTVDPELVNRLAKVAKKYGISDDTFTAMSKNYIDVEQDAVEGRRGYNTQKRKLETLLVDPEANTRQINKTLGQMQGFLDAQIEYEQGLESVISGAEAKMKTNDNAPANALVDTSAVKVTLPKSPSRKKEHTIFAVPTKAGIEKAKLLLETKKRNIEELTTGIRSAHNRVKNAGVEIVDQISEGGIIVPAGKSIDEKTFKKYGVTKMILGKSHPKKWIAFKDIKSNEQFIESTKYNADDVVMISAKDVKKIGKDKSKQIKMAREAGATIMLDGSMPQKTKAGIIATYLKPETSDKIKGEKYVFIKGSKGIFKPESVAKAENKSYEETAAKEKEATDTKAKIQEDAIRKYIELRSNATEDIMKHADMVDHIEKLKPYFKESENKSSEEKVESYLEGVWNKKVERLAKEYSKAMHANEGTLSAKDRNDIAKDQEASMKEMKIAAEKIASEVEVERKSGMNILEAWNNFVERHEELKGTEKYFDTLFDTLSKFKLDRGGIVNTIVKDTSSSLDHTAKNGTVYILPSKRDEKGIESKARVSEKYKEGYRQVIVHTDKYIDTTKTKPTVFNTLPIEYMGEGIEQFADESVDLVNDSIRTSLNKTPKNSKYSEYEFALANSPARGLLLDKDGEVNKSVAMVLRLAIYEYITTNGSMLSTSSKTQEAIMAAHGLEQYQVNRKVRQELGDKGMLRKSMANDVGKTIKEHLGLVAKTDIDKEQMDRLYADLANTAILMGMSEGLLDISEMELNQYNKILGIEGSTKGDQGATVGLVSINKDKFVDSDDKVGLITEVKSTFENIADELPDVVTMRREPSMRKISERRKAKIKEDIRKDKSGFKPAKEAQTALDNLMNQSWKINHKLIKWVTDNVEGRRELIMKALGYVDLNDAKATEFMTFEELDSQKARNRDIEKSIEELEKLMTRVDKESKGDYEKARLFFEWVYVKNGRYMMDSNTINPQTDKQLHRFIVTPEEHEIGYKLSKDSDGNVRFVFDKWVGQKNKDTREAAEEELQNEDVSRQMFYALAQGLGMAVDKKNTQSFVDKMQTLVNAVADTSEIKVGKDRVKIDDIRTKLLEEGKLKLLIGDKEIDIEIEHLAHALQALDLLESVEKGDQKITSFITAEFDAVTSGFGIKLTQMPVIKHLVRYALKVGILPKVLATDAGKKYYEQDKTFAKDHKSLIDAMRDPGFKPSMNDILDGKIKDSYQTLATKIVGLDFDAGLDKQQEKDATKIPNFKTYSYAFNEKGAKAIWKELNKPEVLPQYVEGEDVSEPLRNLFKSPFMVFNYSATIKTIRASLSANMAADVVSKLLKDDNLAKTIIKNTIGLNNKSLEVFRNEIRTKDAKSISLGDRMNLQEYLETMINVTYGAKVEDALTEEFGPFLKIQESINLSFRAMFMAYNVELKERIKELIEKKGFITKAEERQVINDLKEKFPAIKGPLADSEQIQDEGMIGIYSTKTADPEGSVAAQTWVNPKLIKGKKTLKIWHRIKEFDAAVSAGSVVPIHYLDGSFMADVVNGLANEYGRSGTTAIHDAIMPPLVSMDESTKMYNKSYITRTRNYNVVGEIVTSLKRIQEGVNKESDKFKSKEKILIDGKEEEKTIKQIVDLATSSMESRYNEIQDGLKMFHDMLDEDGAYVMHMASMNEGVYEYKGLSQINRAKLELERDGMTPKGAAIMAKLMNDKSKGCK